MNLCFISFVFLPAFIRDMAHAVVVLIDYHLFQFSSLRWWRVKAGGGEDDDNCDPRTAARRKEKFSRKVAEQYLGINQPDVFMVSINRAHLQIKEYIKHVYISFRSCLPCYNVDMLCSYTDVLIQSCVPGPPGRIRTGELNIGNVHATKISIFA